MNSQHISKFDKKSATQRENLILAIMAGETTVEEAAAKNNLDIDEVTTWREMYVAGLRKQRTKHNLKSRLFSIRRRKLLISVTCAFIFVGISGGVVWAQSDGCASGLICFTAKTPAKASEVNGNFKQIVDWMERKVGAVNDSNINAGSIATTGTMSIGGRTYLSPADPTIEAPGRLHITSGEDIYLLAQGDDVIVGNEWGGAANLTVRGNLGTAGTVSGGDLSATSISTSGDLTANSNTWGESSSRDVAAPTWTSADYAVAKTSSVYCPQGAYVVGIDVTYSAASRTQDSSGCPNSNCTECTGTQTTNCWKYVITPGKVTSYNLQCRKL